MPMQPATAVHTTTWSNCLCKPPQRPMNLAHQLHKLSKTSAFVAQLCGRDVAPEELFWDALKEALHVPELHHA